MTHLVFISARSDDYQYAEQIYRYLKSQGLSVFFSQESLPELASSDYRKQIDDALDNAQHMIVVTSSRANVTSSWVEAEWGLFINEKRSGRKLGNLITVITGDLKPSELPASLRYYEVIPFQPGAFPKILRYVTVAIDKPVSRAQTGGLAAKKEQPLRVSAGASQGGEQATQLERARSAAAGPTQPIATSSKDKSTTAETSRKLPISRFVYGAIIGAVLGATNGLLAGFYEVARYQSRLSPIVPAIMSFFLGALFGTIVATSGAGRIVGIIVAIISAIIGAVTEGPSAAVGMGLTFGAVAALIAMAVDFVRKKVLAGP